MTSEHSGRVDAAKSIRALLSAIATFAVVFLAIPLVVASAIELPDSAVWWYLLGVGITFPTCVVVGWHRISEGRRPRLGFALLFGSLLFFIPLLTWFALMLGNAMADY